MLAAERYSKILSIIENEGSVNLQRLMDELDASESTIRRDLTEMAKKKLLHKVHGGAVSVNPVIHTLDEEVHNRRTQYKEEKSVIGAYAASLIKPDDFVYIDAGTTTEMIAQHIQTTEATFVTNAITHAAILSKKGCRVYVIGGEFKSSTEALVGEEAVYSLDKYNFTKGFWGTNGLSAESGCTTPEIKEAAVKRMSMLHCREPYVVADASKFSKVSSVKFAEFDQATILTTGMSNKNKEYKKYNNIVWITGNDLKYNKNI